MSDLDHLSIRMKQDWDRRVSHDYRFWMSDGHRDDAMMWESGERDFALITKGIEHRGTFLELGCGVGRILRAALPHYQKVIGVDVSEAAISKAQTLLGQRENLTLITGNGYDLSAIPDRSVDVAMSFAALVSMPGRVVATYLRELHRVLAPSGIVRIQIYLGSEQAVSEQDTLHLRCYERENFLAAVHAAGFELEGISELVLPFRVSYEELGIKALIVSLSKLDVAPEADSVIARCLQPNGEPQTPPDQSPNDLEYWMALQHANELADQGDRERAESALSYAMAVSHSASLDVRDILDQIVRKISPEASLDTPRDTQDGDYFADNLKVLAERFPQVHDQVQKFCGELNTSPEQVEISTTEQGPVLTVDQQCLDHPEKPVSAATAWVRRTLAEARVQTACDLDLFGFGCGYHVDELLRNTQKTVGVIEPSLPAFVAALRVRKQESLRSLARLHVGTDALPAPRNAEMCVRPQSQAIAFEFASQVRSQLYGERGLSVLHPNIGVVGPFQGGTLPITGYSSRAMVMLGQRVREFDMSGFAPGYHQIERFIFDRLRHSGVQGHYIEMVSQILLEAINEKPIDIIVCMAQNPVSGRVLQELRRRGIITVLWFVEDYLRFTYWREMAQYFDFVFTIQKGPCIDAIRAAGAGEVHYIPTACDPQIHTPLTVSAEERERWGSPISFVGAGYHNRQQMFASLAGMPLKIWGTEWPTCRPFDRMVQEQGRRLTPAEYIKIFNATDININLHSSTERDGVEPNGDFLNPRTFELAACGAFQLVDQRILLSDAFVPDKEIVTFNSLEDLKAKIHYFLEHPDQRKQIAQAARERVLRDHTYEQRFREMFSVIYSTKFESLKRRLDSSPWARMLERSKRWPELHDRCKVAQQRGEEAALDGLVADIMTGKGKLSETEQKLLFLYHVRKQIIRMTMEENGGSK